MAAPPPRNFTGDTFFAWDGDVLVVNILGKPAAAKDAIGKPKGTQLKVSVAAAPKDGTLATLHRGAPLPIKSTEAPKTRQQVVDEMRSEPPEARRARLEMYSGG